MGGKSSRNSPDRQLKALNRDRTELTQRYASAIKTINGLTAHLEKLARRHHRMQQDFLRWIAMFLLSQSKHEMTFPEAFLAKAEGWAVERDNNSEDRTVTWRIVPREEWEAKQKAKEED